uniref:DHA2 family efflux MFS transporter permease subunit n=1 Tax=Burkholderia cenocepacia TaxID=95486 RepID=UPI002AAFD9AA
ILDRSVSESAVDRQQQLVVAVVYVAVVFMAVLDTTIVNVALPTIARDYRVNADDVSMVSIAYLVSLTVFIPVSGWWGDWIGGRRALLAAVGMFTIASALCGLSANLGHLVAFRVLQGIGGAVMTPVGLAMLFRVYPPSERVRISSVLAMFTALAPASGPILGGLFTSYVSWRLVFFINVPIGMAVFAYGAIALANHRPAHPGRLNVVSLALSGLGLGATMYGVSEGPSRGWSSLSILFAIVVGIAALALMVVVELRAPNPLVDLRLLRNRLFAATTGVYGFGSAAYIGALFLASVFFQDALEISAAQSGFLTLPSALGVMAGGQIVTRILYSRIGPRRIAVSGLVLVFLMMMTMAQVTGDTSVWRISMVMFGLGLGVSFAFIAAQGASMATLGKAAIGRASSIFNAGKQLGGAIGVATLSTILAAQGHVHQLVGSEKLDLKGYHIGFIAAGFMALVGGAVAITISDGDAVDTMRQRR